MTNLFPLPGAFGWFSYTTSRDTILAVTPQWLSRPIIMPEGTGIQDVFLQVCSDTERTAKIVAEAGDAFDQGRKIPVLTERTDHLNAIEEQLVGRVENLFTLHGRMSKKQRSTLICELEALPADAPRVILATGKLVGEGFDHPGTGYLGTGHAGFLEGYSPAVCGPPVSGTCE